MTRGAVARIVLVDSQPIFRAGLQHVCRTDERFEVIGAYPNATAGLPAIESRRPDVAVVEYDLPDQSGAALIDACHAASEDTRVLILSARRDGADVYDAIAAGAAGYLLKTVDPVTICTAIDAVATGETVLDPGLHRSVAAEIRLHASRARVDLTVREREVLGLVAEGYSSREIGARLFVSEATVKTHLGKLYDKLGVSSRAAAVAEAMKRGLVETV
jgi:two-component system, NarL family, nitrate/nitrite response regulator NarL